MFQRINNADFQYVENGECSNKTSTDRLLKEFCGSNTDGFHDIASTLWYFPQCGMYNLKFPHCGNYNVDFPIRRKISLKFSAKVEVNNLCSTIYKVYIEL